MILFFLFERNNILLQFITTTIPLYSFSKRNFLIYHKEILIYLTTTFDHVLRFYIQMSRYVFSITLLLISLFSTAQERGDSAELIYRQAYAIELGNDTVRGNIAKAIPLYLRAAKSGYAPAQSYLGFCYYNGNGVERNASEAIRWIEKAARQGDIKACNNLGWLLANGDEVVRDYRKAAYWFKKASDAGLPMAQAQLADLYQHGLGVESDSTMARSLYKKAIASGLADAEKKLLAMDYDNYLSMQPEKAVEEGIEYYQIQAYDIAATLFEIAYSKGDNNATFWLAESYAHGRGVDYDFDKALSLYYQAACNGHPSAQFIVGETLEMFPDAIPADRHGAKYWLDKAHQAGIDNAEDAYRHLFSPPTPTTNNP